MRTQELLKVKFSTKKEIPETTKKHKLREAFPLLSSLLHSYDPATTDSITAGLTNGLRDIFLHLKKGGFDMTQFKNRANWDKALFEAETIINDEEAILELLRKDPGFAALINPIMEQDLDMAGGIIMAVVAADSVFQGRLRPLTIDQMIEREHEETTDEEPERDFMDELLADDPEEFVADAPPQIDHHEEEPKSAPSSDLKELLKRIGNVTSAKPIISYDHESDSLEVVISCGSEVPAGVMSDMLGAMYEISPDTRVAHNDGDIVLVTRI